MHNKQVHLTLAQFDLLLGIRG